MKTSRFATTLLFVSSLASVPSYAELHSQTFSASAGALSAEVTFSTNVSCISNCVLTIQLTNTSAVSPAVPADVLTSLFFNFSGAPTLTARKALVASGSSVITTSSGGAVSTLYGAGTNVGSQWAFSQAPNIAGATGASYGISAAGLGIFGGGDLFCQPGPGCPTLIAGTAGAAPDGLAFGIVPTAYTGASNGGVANRSLIQSSAIFSLKGVSGDLTGMISNVSFQYGTSLSEPTLHVPEPATILVLGFGLVGMMVIRRRRSLRFAALRPPK